MKVLRQIVVFGPSDLNPDEIEDLVEEAACTIEDSLSIAFPDALFEVTIEGA